MFLFLRWIRRHFRDRGPLGQRPRGVRLGVQLLEDRVVPSTPYVSAINFSSPGGPSTNASSVVYTVAFNTPVNGVDAADFQVVTSGATHAATPVVVAGSNSFYTVTVNGIQGSGTLQLNLIDNDGITSQDTGTPLGGAGAGNGSFQGRAYTILQADPYVVSINRQAPPTSVTNSGAVRFSVTFSEPVIGVTPTDFKLATTGNVASTLTQIAGSGSTYTVTISGITGVGTIGLQLVDNGSITDLAGNPLAPASVAPSFQSQSVVVSGSRPYSVAVGDINGDGVPDLLIANAMSNSVTVLLGNGNGTFAAQANPIPGNSPYSVALGDFNGDGRPDLAVANFQSNNVSVLLGNGNGTFQLQHTFAVGGGPFSVVAADINGDGKTDLAIANLYSGSVSVLLGNGDGTFQAQATFATGPFSTSVKVADINGDGKPDLIVANYQGSDVSVLIGNGNGSFQAQTTFSVGHGPLCVTAGDVNGDGKLDLAVTNNYDGTVSLLLGNGNGTFQAQTTLATGSYPQSVAVADLNGDGKLDLIVVNAGNGNVGVYQGNGNGTFQAPSTFAAGSFPHSVAVADLNHDGKPDLVVTNAQGANVSVLLGNITANGNFTGEAFTIDPTAHNVYPSVLSINLAAPVASSTSAGSADYTVTFSEPVTGVNLSNFQLAFTGTATATLTQISGGGSVYTVTIGNIAGNGTFGLSLVDNGSIKDLAGNPLVQTNAAASFQGQSTYGVSGFPFSVAVGDFNGDGTPDLVVANYSSNSVSVLLGNGNGTFQNQTTYATGSNPVSVVVADVNGDGKADLAIANITSTSVSVLLGNGNGTFQAQSTLAVGSNPRSVAVADVNGDGIPDLIVANSFSGAGGNSLSILLGNGNGTFQAQQTFATGSEPSSVAVVDVNGDGKPDLVVANFNANNLSVLLGNGNGTFQNQTTFAAGSGPISVAAADLNGDGKPDLVVANLFGNSVSVLLGSGNGTFQAQATHATGLYPGTVAIADVNGDGKLDLIVANSQSSNVSVIQGNGDGTFPAQATFAAGSGPTSVAVADVNGDDKADLVVTNETANSVSVLLANGNGNFTGQVVSTVDTPISASPLVVNHGTVTNVRLDSLDPSPVGAVSYTVALLDPLAAIETQYNLLPQDGFFNLRGQNEKYLLSNNGSNSGGQGFYVLMPNGNLYPYLRDATNDLTSTLAQAPATTFAPSVYYNPALLTDNIGAPLVTSGTNPLYDLKIQLGLGNPVIAADTNLRKANEQYLQSTNGSNPTGQGFYVLMPDNKLYAWQGSLAANQLLADFNTAPYSANVYANSTLLTSASLPTTVNGVAVATGAALGGTLTLIPAAGFDRGVQVTVTATDNARSTTQTFHYTVNDTAPNVPAVSPITALHNAPAPSFNLGATDAEGVPLTYTATVSGYNPLYDLHAQLGLTTSDQSKFFNFRKQNEKYLQSGNGSNPTGQGFYVLMPTDKLYAYVANASNDLAATLAGAPVADFTAAPYSNLGNVYNLPALLYKSVMPAAPTVASNRGPLYDVQTQFGLTTPDQTKLFNHRHQNEKYLLSGNGGNPTGSGLYVLMPTNLLYAYVPDATNDLTATLANSPVFDFTPAGPVYAEPNLLYAAQPAFVNDPVFNLKQLDGLATADQAQFFDKRGQNEKYLQSGNGGNSAGQGFYVLTQTDKLYAYVADANNDLVSTLATAPVADFTLAPYAAFLGAGNVYNSPALLYASTGQVAALTAAISSNGVLTVTPNIAFVGTARITAAASDGAETTGQSFLITVIDNTPTLQPIGPVSASSAAGSQTVNFTAGTFNGAPVLAAASVAGDNPLFDLKSLDGLTTPDQTKFFNHRHQNEKYLQSGNGSNSAGQGFYVLMPTNELFAYVPDANNDLTATLAGTPVANFNLAPYAALGNVYNTPSLLYNATQPAAPSITTSFPSAGALKLQWPNGFTGTFSVTLTIGDGALETMQSFLVTVS